MTPRQAAQHELKALLRANEDAPDGMPALHHLTWAHLRDLATPDPADPPGLDDVVLSHRHRAALIAKIWELPFGPRCVTAPYLSELALQQWLIAHADVLRLLERELTRLRQLEQDVVTMRRLLGTDPVIEIKEYERDR